MVAVGQPTYIATIAPTTDQTYLLTMYTQQKRDRDGYIAIESCGTIIQRDLEALPDRFEHQAHCFVKNLKKQFHRLE